MHITITKEESKVLKESLNVFELDDRIIKIAEEMGELAQALSKYRSGKIHDQRQDMQRVVTEMSDVMIMLAGFLIRFDEHPFFDFEEIMDVQFDKFKLEVFKRLEENASIN